MRVIYDTNILLQLLRHADSMERLQAKLRSQYLDYFVSIVTVAEIRSLAIQFNWGNNRINKMKEVLSDLSILDINLPEIIERKARHQGGRYVEIDCYSKRKHPNLISEFSAIKMGKNDLLIAATALVHQCTLLTMDLDFNHLHDKFIDIVYFESLMFRD